MKRTTATLALAVALLLPATSQAGDIWDAVKREWEYRPWALFLAAPAFVVSSPFMLAKVVMDSFGSEETEFD